MVPVDYSDIKSYDINDELKSRIRIGNTDTFLFGFCKALYSLQGYCCVVITKLS